MDSLCRVRNKIMYVLSWLTVSAPTRVLFLYLFPSLPRNSGNKHKNNPLASAETVRHLSTYQGWGQFRNWNWNWYQFQFQFQELELQRNWIKGIGTGIGIDNKELKELIQFLFLIVNSFWFFCYVFQDFTWMTWLISSQTILNIIHKNITRWIYYFVWWFIN